MIRRKPEVRPPLDWEAARRKLAIVEPTPAELAESASRILRERAARLAVVGAEAGQAEESFLEVLTFERSGRRYAIESRFVVEAGKCGKLSRVPGAAPVLLGITNLRGDILPVFDLAFVAGVESAQPLSPLLLVLGGDAPDFGILADSIEQVNRMPLSALSGAASVGSMPHPEYVRGVTADACVLLDGDAVLRDRSVFVATPAVGSTLERD